MVIAVLKRFTEDELQLQVTKRPKYQGCRTPRPKFLGVRTLTTPTAAAPLRFSPVLVLYGATTVPGNFGTDAQVISALLELHKRLVPELLFRRGVY